VATLLFNDERDTDCIRLCRSSAHMRLMTRLRASRLDAALANGASPDSSAALSLHAHTLISATTRRELSCSIHRVLRKAERPHHPYDSTAPVCRHKILQATIALEELADYLQGPDPVAVRGVAQVRLLLRDGSSPLYNHPRADDLHRSLQTALDALALRG